MDASALKQGKKDAQWRKGARETEEDSPRLLLMPETWGEKIQGSIDYIFPNSWWIDASWEKASRGLGLTFWSPDKYIVLWQVHGLSVLPGPHPALGPIWHGKRKEGWRRDPPPYLITCSEDATVLGHRLYWGSPHQLLPRELLEKKEVLKWTPRTEIKKGCILNLNFENIPIVMLWLH